VICRFKTSAAFLLVASVVVTTPGRAQTAPTPEQVAQSDALFKDAQALLEAGKPAEACSKFAASQKVAPGLGVTLYLADCYERIGRSASAFKEFKRAEELALARKDPRSGLAHARAASLEPTVPTMTIHVPAEARASGLEIKRDDVIVPEKEWEVGVPVDPGLHLVVASAPGRRAREIARRVQSAEKNVLTLPVLEDTSVAVAPPPPNGTQPAPNALRNGGADAPPKDGGSQRLVGLAGVGVGVIGVALGVGLGLAASSKLSASNADNHCDAADACDKEGLGLRSDASGLATGSTIASIVGVVALAGGAILYFTAPKGAARAVALSALGVKSAPGRAELTLAGAF
jgi:hypothetical protein